LPLQKTKPRFKRTHSPTTLHQPHAILLVFCGQVGRDLFQILTGSTLCESKLPFYQKNTHPQ